MTMRRWTSLFIKKYGMNFRNWKKLWHVLLLGWEFTSAIQHTIVGSVVVCQMLICHSHLHSFWYWYCWCWCWCDFVSFFPYIVTTLLCSLPYRSSNDTHHHREQQQTSHATTFPHTSPTRRQRQIYGGTSWYGNMVVSTAISIAVRVEHSPVPV